MGSSAGQISRNAELRREFYTSAASQLSLLKAIGVSQMEKELEKNVLVIESNWRQTVLYDQSKD